MYSTLIAFNFFLLAVQVSAQSPIWGQCGGIGWTGGTTCVGGSVCTQQNDYYSQCIPGAGSSTPGTVAPTPVPTTVPQGPTTTSSGAMPTGSQIRAVEAPVYHFYLQSEGTSIVFLVRHHTFGVIVALTLGASNRRSADSYFSLPGGKPVLGPEASSGYFTIGNTISLNDADGSKLFLNINESAPASYKPLSLDAVATTTDWGLEGDTIITTAPRQLNFLACVTSDAAVYDVYLQEGNDSPTGASCSLATLHLPCLC